MDKHLQALRSAMSELRRLDPDMKLTEVELLLMVAVKGEVGFKEIEESLDLPQQTASRYLAMLSSRKVKGQEGLGLVDRFEDPEDPRKKVVRLSHKGKRLMARINAILEGNENAAEPQAAS